MRTSQACISLTHNVVMSHSLSNCYNQVIHSRLFPAYYSFSRLLSQSCDEAQAVIVLWMSFYSDCKARGWLNVNGWWKNGSVGFRKDGFIGRPYFIVQQHMLCNMLICFHLYCCFTLSSIPQVVGVSVTSGSDQMVALHTATQDDILVHLQRGQLNPNQDRVGELVGSLTDHLTR